MASPPRLGRIWLVALTGLAACGGLYELNPLYQGSGSGDGDSDASTSDTTTGDGDGDPSGGEAETGTMYAEPPEGMVGDSPTTVWIDATEVSVEQYANFLAGEPAAPPSAPRCADKTDYTPDMWAEQAGALDKPVGGVDWCDALAYCEHAGKRLCRGKTSDPFDAVSSENEWFWACSNKLASSYPYGGSYDAQACNGADKQFGASLDVGDLPSCEGGFPGLFDMSGNVWEWTDACGEVEGEEQCVRRGGSFFSEQGLLDCAAAVEQPFADRKDWIGFRCCADPEFPDD